jgi:hypothetical protein
MAWPTTDDPRTEFVTLRLTKAEAADLDQFAASLHGGVRSKAVRSCVERVLAAERKRAARTRRAAKPGAGMTRQDED